VLHIARLGHEAIDHPVEGDVVIGAGARQLLDARHVLGRHVGEKLHDHRAILQLDDEGIFGILDFGHLLFLCFAFALT